MNVIDSDKSERDPGAAEGPRTRKPVATFPDPALAASLVALVCLASLVVLARPLPAPLATSQGTETAAPVGAADIAKADAGGWPSLLAGPVPARVVRVVDGDTLVVEAYVWIGQAIEVAVRLRGIDAPERQGRCPAERERAARATRWLERAAAPGEAVTLTRIAGDKYFGRVVAEVTTREGRALGPALLAAGHARPYEGGRRAGWCGAG